MIDVLVALREPFLRLGVEAALKEAEDCRVVGSVGDVGEVEGAVDRWEPKVVLLDVAFQRADRGLIGRLVEARPHLRVLVLVEHTDEECSLRALLADPQAARFSEEALENLDECCLTSLRSAARGCVPRTSEPARLLHAIRTVAAGEIAAAPWLAAMVATGSTKPRKGGPAPISGRELEVITLVAAGMGNKQIARKLGIREQTVKNHLASIMQKLGAKSRLEVGLTAVRQNLTSDPSPAPDVDPPN